MEKASASIGAIVMAGLCIAYVIVFSAYKKAVANHEFLVGLFNNPNVRVASGEKAT